CSHPRRRLAPGPPPPGPAGPRRPPPRGGGPPCHTVRIPELDGSRPLHARHEAGVLAVVAERPGRYDRLVFRFAPDYASYDLRVVRDVTPAAPDFAVLDTGVVVCLGEAEGLEIFSRRKGDPALRRLDDPSVRGARLFHCDDGLLLARGDQVLSAPLGKLP